MKIGKTLSPYFSKEPERCATQKKLVEPPRAYGTRTSLRALGWPSKEPGINNDAQKKANQAMFIIIGAPFLGTGFT
jgi:hypothetical protein